MDAIAYQDVPISALRAEERGRFLWPMTALQRERIPGIPCHYTRPLPKRPASDLPERHVGRPRRNLRSDCYSPEEDRIILDASAKGVRGTKLVDALAWHGFHRTASSIHSRISLLRGER